LGAPENVMKLDSGGNDPGSVTFGGLVMFIIVAVVPAKATNPPCCAVPGPFTIMILFRNAILPMEILAVPVVFRTPRMVVALAGRLVPSKTTEVSNNARFITVNPPFQGRLI
jgi:hypothetical protein